VDGVNSLIYWMGTSELHPHFVIIIFFKKNYWMGTSELHPHFVIIFLEKNYWMGTSELHPHFVIIFLEKKGQVYNFVLDPKWMKKYVFLVIHSCVRMRKKMCSHYHVLYNLWCVLESTFPNTFTLGIILYVWDGMGHDQQVLPSPLAGQKQWGCTWQIPRLAVHSVTLKSQGTPWEVQGTMAE
jgi:hypothetical protein